MIAFRGWMIFLVLIFGAGTAGATSGTFYNNSVGYHGPIYTSRDGSTTAGCYNNPNWRIYESDHFLIYSDLSSDEVRVQLAVMAEAEFDAAKTLLGVTDAELGINPAVPSTKLHVCSDGVGSDATGTADGFRMPALDGQHLDPMDRLNNHYGYRHTIRHELIHVIQGILAHDDLSGSGLETWFFEGQAVWISQQETLMDTLALADYYAAGRPNPLSVKTGQAMVDAGLSSDDVYPAFGLAVKYLFDAAPRGGAGNELLVSRDLFQRIRNGAGFSDAFAAVFSRAGAPLTLAAYKDHFQAWMSSYLGSLETPGTVTGGGGISMVGVFPDHTGCDLMTGFGSTVTPAGAFTLNVSELADGTYENALCFLGDDGTIYGPSSITVACGKLSPASFDVAPWPRRCATLYPDADGFTSSSASGNVIVASMNCDWTAVSHDSWIAVTSGAGGTGEGTVSYTVSANTTGTTRTGSMTIAGRTFTVTQSGSAAPLYFPHVATTDDWRTEIAVINTGSQAVNGTLKAFSNGGQAVENRAVALAARGRREINVAAEFALHAQIGYIVFETDSPAVRGYTKFYIDGVYRAAVPAVREVNSSDIRIPHIASTADWWTGISLVNTLSSAKEMTIAFSDGRSRAIPLAANGHSAFDIADLFGGLPQPEIQSAVISNANGVIGLELFGGLGWGTQLEGVLLTDRTASTIYYPHVAGGDWWTGIVAYNPWETTGTITITPFSGQGASLPASVLPIAAKGKYVGAVAELGLPAETAWFRIDSTSPLSGFELFGATSGSQLGAYAGDGGTGAKAGIFAKIEKSGWTGIAFVNTESDAASVTLTACDNDGGVVATQTINVNGHAKVVNTPETIFSQDIGAATYIAYASDRNVVGFQLNGSADGTMLDGLPGMGAAD